MRRLARHAGAAAAACAALPGGTHYRWQGQHQVGWRFSEHHWTWEGSALILAAGSNWKVPPTSYYTLMLPNGGSLARSNKDPMAAAPDAPRPSPDQVGAKLTRSTGASPTHHAVALYLTKLPLWPTQLRDEVLAMAKKLAAAGLQLLVIDTGAETARSHPSCFHASTACVRC